MNSEDVFEDIKSKGKKLTKVRRSIVKTLMEGHAILTADDVKNKLLDKGIKVNKTTIYRELSFLLSQRIIKEVLIKPGIVHYESALHPHHHHITCNNCGRIEEIDTSELDDSMKKLESYISRKGYNVADHQLEFYGICAGCINL